MAQVKLLKINASGLPEEMDVASDEITLASFTVDGGGPVLSGTGLDMNNQAISDVDDISFTDPSTDGFTTTDGTFAADNMMFENKENEMTAAGAILFGTISDVADEVDSFGVPNLAGAPTATPSDAGHHLVYDSVGQSLYVWDGTAWDNLSTVSSAETLCNEYTAAAAIAAGEVLHISAADEVDLADVSGNGIASRVIGVAKGAAAAAASVEVACNGVVSGYAGLTAGSRYFADPATPGAVTSSVPTASGSKIIQIGYAKSASEMHLQIDFKGRRA